MKTHAELLESREAKLDEATYKLMDAMGIRPNPLREEDEEKPARE